MSNIHAVAPKQEFSSQVIVHHISFELCGAHDLGAAFQDAILRGKAEHVAKLWKAHCYEPVAIVRAGVISNIGHNELDKAFNKTNNVEEAWTNPVMADKFGVTVLGRDRCRSTMVGDVMVAIVPGKPTRVWAVSYIGFDELTGV
jgi:1,6-anhydro-N-acetylmuramate kinase